MRRSNGIAGRIVATKASGVLGTPFQAGDVIFTITSTFEVMRDGAPWGRLESDGTLGPSGAAAFSGLARIEDGNLVVAGEILGTFQG